MLSFSCLTAIMFVHFCFCTPKRHLSRLSTRKASIRSRPQNASVLLEHLALHLGLKYWPLNKSGKSKVANVTKCCCNLKLIIATELLYMILFGANLSAKAVSMRRLKPSAVRRSDSNWNDIFRRLVFWTAWTTNLLQKRKRTTSTTLSIPNFFLACSASRA